MKAFIKNNITQREYSVVRDSMQELNDFIAYQKAKPKCPWGKLEQTLLVDPTAYPERAVFVEEVVTEEPKFDENFEPVMETETYTDEDGVEQTREVQVFETVTKHKVTIPQEFTVLIDEVPEDKSAEYLAELRGKIENILDKTDWLFISDVTVDSTHRVVYRDYRAKLRMEHSRESSYYKSESEYTIEAFENYARRTKPEMFMEGGLGPAMVKKFMSKL